jgi:ribokinase
MSKPLMVCIGKVGQDVFLQGDVFKPKRENGILYEHMQLGSKYYVENAIVETGNNALNAAVTFARQRLPVRLVSVVGDDTVGRNILHAIDREHIDASDVAIKKNAATSFSTILLAPSGERTILDYPGTVKIDTGNIQSFDYQADWLYVSSVGSMALLKKIMQQAVENNVKIAFNPASYELKHVQETAELLQYVTLFAVNKEEARLFVDGASITQLALQLVQTCDYVLVSDGPKGAVATDGTKIVKAGLYEDVPVKDRTGAGDAFTSGFVTMIALEKTLEHALTFASANSTSVVQHIGANVGVLHSHAEFHEMPLEVTELK